VQVDPMDDPVVGLGAAALRHHGVGGPAGPFHRAHRAGCRTRAGQSTSYTWIQKVSNLDSHTEWIPKEKFSFRRGV